VVLSVLRDLFLDAAAEVLLVGRCGVLAVLVERGHSWQPFQALPEVPAQVVVSVPRVVR
jgi:hypothetical protein